MGMVETTDGSGFPFKAFSEVGSLGEVFGQDLEGDFSVQEGVFSQVDLTHIAFTDFLQDLVVSDECSDYGALPLFLGC